MRVGLISDTHGLLRPEAVAALEGSDHIIHAGDIGPQELLERLARIAPLTVVRGNNDTAPWAMELPERATLDIDGLVIHVIHDLKQWPGTPPEADVRVIVAGHSHRPHIQTRDGVLHVNPGSAGRRRFSLPVSVGRLQVDGGDMRASIIELEV